MYILCAGGHPVDYLNPHAGYTVHVHMCYGEPVYCMAVVYTCTCVYADVGA